MYSYIHKYIFYFYYFFSLYICNVCTCLIFNIGENYMHLYKLRAHQLMSSSTLYYRSDNHHQGHHYYHHHPWSRHSMKLVNLFVEQM